MTPPLPNLGLGILSWRGYDSLRATLKGYRDSGMLDLLGETLVFLPQMEQQGIDLATEFDVPHTGTSDNLGILGGFKAMAEAMKSDYVILAENDFQLVDESKSPLPELARALDHLKSGKSHVWRFRHLQQPGQTFHIEKILKYWPAENASLMTKIVAIFRRLFRPKKAHKLKGMTVYIYQKPEEKFPDVIKRLPTGDLLVRSDVLNWANNVFLIERKFFLETLLPVAEAHIGGRLINGFPTIETELNRSQWWKDQKLWIGVSAPGLFTHDRLNDRGY
ncbi:MAG TPA: hypothetical protein PKI93_06435 [Alphaproteobacteria bacterium]|nr:hypothetical protein [Alphaproteobacteria bacterium]HNS44046.1 hypothetical protein [Alphaproteobacteria bacterium]